MDKLTFALLVVRWSAITIICLVAIIGGCAINADYLISLDIKGGANPIAAQCAHAINTNESRCAIAAVR
jgi:hypothetical protein